MNKKEAIEYLRKYRGQKFRTLWGQVWATKIHDAVLSLCPDFEYPDWSWRIVDDFLRKFGVRRMKYRVILTRAATESTTVEVEADTAEEANDKALEIAGRYGENLGNWELDEGNNHEVYLPDPESTEPV